MKQFLILLLALNVGVGYSQESQKSEDAPIPTEIDYAAFGLEASSSSPSEVEIQAASSADPYVWLQSELQDLDLNLAPTPDFVKKPELEFEAIEPSACSLEGSYQGVTFLFDDRTVEYDVEISRASGDDSSLFMSIELSEPGAATSSSIIVQLQKDAASGAYKFAGSPNFSEEDAVLGLSLSDKMELGLLQCDGQGEGESLLFSKASGLDSSSIILNRKAEDDSELGEQDGGDLQGPESELEEVQDEFFDGGDEDEIIKSDIADPALPSQEDQGQQSVRSI